MAEVTPSTNLELLVLDPILYEGTFVWSFTDLRHRISEAITAYDYRDPLTWPMIRTESIGNPPDQRAYLPAYVVYDPLFMEDFVTANSDRLPRKQSKTPTKSDESVKINTRFCYYPFNFDTNGDLRGGFAISAADYRKWVSQWADAPPSNQPNINIMTPEKIYERVMGNFSENEFISADEMIELRDELDKAKERATAAEHKIESLQQKHSEAMSEQKKEADETLKLVKLLLEEKDKQLSDARTEIMRANERLANIYIQMQLKKRISSQKRKKESDDEIVEVSKRKKQSEDEDDGAAKKAVSDSPLFEPEEAETD